MGDDAQRKLNEALQMSRSVHEQWPRITKVRDSLDTIRKQHDDDNFAAWFELAFRGDRA